MTYFIVAFILTLICWAVLGFIVGRKGPSGYVDAGNIAPLLAVSIIFCLIWVITLPIVLLGGFGYFFVNFFILLGKKSKEKHKQ